MRAETKAYVRRSGWPTLLAAWIFCAGAALANTNDSRPIPEASSEAEEAASADQVVSPPAGPEAPETAGAGTDMARETALASSVTPVYVPPRRGAPKTRVGGGTRSGGTTLEVALLAPEHTGITAKASPTLYWWLSDAYEGEFEFVVTRRDAVQPDFRDRRTLSLAAGIHALDLEEAGLVLDPGESYQWAVAVIRDPDRRSRDVVAIATLEFHPRTDDAGDAPAALASAGLFYDAIAALNAESAGAGAAGARADLLEQVALTNVARWIRSDG